ncbi:hypothetical protein OAV62_01240 [bacterium]|nr:hypothetical protein [bacterium]
MLATNQIQEISLLGLNTTFKFLRTGVIGDGRCLLHSILYLLNQDYFSTTDSHERVQLVQTFLNDLSRTVTLRDWIQYSLGEHSVINIILSIRKTLSSRYESTYLDTVFENIVSITDIDNLELDTAEATQELREKIIPVIIHKLFEMYKHQLVQCQDLGFQEVHYMSNKYKVNILMFDQTKHLFKDTWFNPEFTHTIFLYNVDGVHWEPVTCMVPTTNVVHRSIISSQIHLI